MRNVLKAAVALPLVAYGWIVAASAIYCFGTGKMALFLFPFTQWIQAAPYWKLNTTMTASVIGSAAAPTVLLIVCAIGMIRHSLRNGPAAIYGKTGWASPTDMQTGGLRLKDRI